jgi:ribose 5-phosphate isomerase A
MSIENLKRAAGYRAVDYIESGMVVGLGSGSTARYATLRIAELLRQGILRDIVAIPTSNETAQLATDQGIRLTTLQDRLTIDVTIDGADEVDPSLNVIKGHGGFLLREKIVAAATGFEIIIVDDSKCVPLLGTRFAVPVEVVQFGWRQAQAALERTGAQAVRRMSAGQPYVTDEGNYILDCRYPGISAPQALSQRISGIPGVVENGLFLDLVHLVIVASPEGTRLIER